jgi:hypothetical protein
LRGPGARKRPSALAARALRGREEATLAQIEASQQYAAQADPGINEAKAEVQMVEIARKELVMVFRVLDRDGRPIGEIVQPKVAPVVGRGARTVLLVRGKPGGKTQPAAM